MILGDTSVLYALTDSRDNHHSQCRTWLSETDEAILVPPTVLAETCYLIDRAVGPETEAAFLEDVGVGHRYRYQLVELVDTDLRRMVELVRRYSDRNLGGTDASIIALAERLGITTVATINHRDFANVRPHHTQALDLVP